MYHFAQALWEQSNNFAEITAIAKVNQLITRLQINPHNKRIFILTDSAIAYNMAFKAPDQNSDYPQLHNALLNNLWNTGNQKPPTLIKVTSHLEDKRRLDPIEENEHADEAAGEAASFSLAHPSHQTPLLIEWSLSKLSTVAPHDPWWCGKRTDGWDFLAPPG